MLRKGQKLKFRTLRARHGTSGPNATIERGRDGVYQFIVHYADTDDWMRCDSLAECVSRATYWAAMHGYYLMKKED